MNVGFQEPQRTLSIAATPDSNYLPYLAPVMDYTDDFKTKVPRP